MNSIQFNIIFGLFSALGFLFSSLDVFGSIPFFVLGIFCLFLYVGEYWAFLYKLKVARIKELLKLTKGNPNSREAMGTEPGCMMFYAFLMRFVFRIVVGMIPVISFGGGGINEDLNTIQVICMILIVLFDVFTLMYSMYETHIFKLSGEDPDTEKEIESYWESEKKWRTANYSLLKKENTRKKEIFASIILLIMASVTTHFLWGGMNDEFVDFIIRTEKNGESISFAVLSVIISCFVLCLFFLMPIRLAFWVEEKMKADEKPEIMRYRLSILFAGVSICSPSIIQLFASFVLK